MQKEYFRQTGCYLSKCIRSIQKTVNTVISTTSSSLCISIKEKYWDVQTNSLIEKMTGMNKDEILDAIYQLEHEDEEYHEGIIGILINEYDEYSASCEGDGTDSTVSDELNKLLTESDLDDLDSCLIDMKNMDRNPAAREDPIKDTPSLKSPITKSHLGKRLRQSESEPTDMIPVDMRPVVTESLAITDNTFYTETLTENPIVTELNVIGQEGSRAVIGGTHTQSIIEGRKDIIHGDVITQLITNRRQMSLKGDSFPFDKEQAQTLMLTSLVEAILACNWNIGTKSMLGASRPNHSRIFAPGMHEDISVIYNVRSTVRNDVREADKLDTTVDGPTTNERNTASS